MTGWIIAFAMPAWFGLLIYLGHRFPVVPNIPLHAYVTNFLTAFVAFLISLPMAYLAGGAAAAITAELGLQMSILRPAEIGVGIAWLDPVLRVLAMIFVPLIFYDLWLAIAHRLEHYIPAFWAFHKVHHSDRWLNPLSIFRDSFVQVIWRSFVPILTIGIFVDLSFREGGAAALYSTTFLRAWAAFSHSNIRVELPFLDRILVTPQYHRIHHSLEPQHADKNFAAIFPIFDMLFGSYWRPRPGEFPETGLSSGERIDGIVRAVTAPFQTWFGREPQPEPES